MKKHDDILEQGIVDAMSHMFKPIPKEEKPRVFHYKDMVFRNTDIGGNQLKIGNMKASTMSKTAASKIASPPINNSMINADRKHSLVLSHRDEDYVPAPTTEFGNSKARAKALANE